MQEARIWRKRFGGGMRQVGILAAAGLHALDHHVERLADDHARARRFAEAAAQAAPGSVDPQRVQTNIVVLDVAAAGWTPAGFVEAAAARGIRLYPVSTTAVRLVWHLDVDDAATDLAVDALAPLLESGPDRAL
jgi:threonine aldolase